VGGSSPSSANEKTLMENLLNSITTDKLVPIILIIGALIIAFAIIKELFKIALFIFIAVILYAAFLSYTGQKIPMSKDEALKHGYEQAEWIKKESGKMIKDWVK
jgi:type III secretory pathway component EscV